MALGLDLNTSEKQNNNNIQIIRKKITNPEENKMHIQSHIHSQSHTHCQKENAFLFLVQFSTLDFVLQVGVNLDIDILDLNAIVVFALVVI